MKALHSASGTGIGYNPGVTYRGGEFIAQGIAQAGNAITKGIEQWQKNREERDFLDEQYKSRVAALSQFSDFEKTANEDDTSPAGRLIKSMSNWDNKSLSAKKAALMDADLLINKSEQAQRRAEDNQRWLLDKQRAEELVKLQQRTMDETQRANRVREDMDWRRLMGAEGQRVFNNVRALDADRRAQDAFDLNQQLGQFNLGQAQTKAQQALADRAALSRFLQLSQPVDVGPMPPIGFNVARAASETGGLIPPSDVEAFSKMNRPEFVPRVIPLPGGGSAMTTSEHSAVPWERLGDTKPPLQGRLIPGAPGYVEIGGKAFKAGDSATAEAPGMTSKIKAEMDRLLADITEDEAQLAGGDTRTWYGGSRADRLKENRAKLDTFRRNYGGQAPAATPAPAPAPQPAPARPNTQAEFDALPSGTLFINPANGQTMRKK